MVLQGANSIGNTKKSENCFNLSSFWVGGFLGWFPKTVLPDISVQLLALDGVAVNPIQYQLIFWPYNGVQSFNKRHIFYILTPFPPSPPKKGMVGWFIALWRFLHGDVSSTVLKTWKTREKMAPNHGLKYPKCILTQKGWFLFISEAFGAFWVH